LHRKDERLVKISPTAIIGRNAEFQPLGDIWTNCTRTPEADRIMPASE
jgi:hypothetical protein